MKKSLKARLPSMIRDFSRVRVYRAEKLLQRVRFSHLEAPEGGWPILLGISFPKSGTHLLNQILLGFSKVAPFSRHIPLMFAAYEGETGRKRSVDEALAYLNALRPLDVTAAHLLAWPQVVARVCTPDFVPYFIFRDPRDVVVSHVFYIAEMLPGHHHHVYYRSLKSFDERLKVSILGLPEADVEFPDIAGRFAFYTDWLDHPEVLPLHFEDFIHNRRAALGEVLDHFLKRVGTLPTPREQILDELEASIDPSRSPTFRSGRTGEWKKYFTDEHKRIFKDVAGDLLIRLGYEKDNDW
ncbi:MAG: sulfotransferase domain-containing protein, partial [Chloroflexi bacterium]|nr:sulfotransferase domain-containing protein [Chloroflexota bacterium]